MRLSAVCGKRELINLDHFVNGVIISFQTRSLDAARNGTPYKIHLKRINEIPSEWNAYILESFHVRSFFKLLVASHFHCM